LIILLLFVELSFDPAVQPLLTTIDMEQRNFDYSLKNISISCKESYLKSMIGKLESFINDSDGKLSFSKRN